MEAPKEKPLRWHDHLFEYMILIVISVAAVVFVKYVVVPWFARKEPTRIQWDGRSLIQLKEEAERQKR